MSSVAVVVGNPAPGSRTRLIGESLGHRVARATGMTLTPSIELFDHAGEMFHLQSDALDAAVGQVVAARIAIFASPTYKASYTGLLKAFLDRFPSDGLAGVVAVPLLTIGSPVHSLAVEFTLRPLLVELGASVPTRGLAFETARIDELDLILDEWMDRNGGPLMRCRPTRDSGPSEGGA